MRNGRYTYTPAPADQDGFASTITIASAGSLVLNGTLVTDGVGTHPSVCVIRETRDNQPRNTTGASLVTITSLGSDETGITLTVVGTNVSGGTLSETLTGPTTSATVTSSEYFATITSVRTSGALVGNIDIGISVDQITPPVRPSQNAFEPFIIQSTVTGSMSYSLEATSDSSPVDTADTPYVKMTDFRLRTSNTLGNIITPLGAIRANISVYTSGAFSFILGETTKG